MLSVSEQGVNSLAAINQIYGEFAGKGMVNGKPVQELIFKIIREQKELSLTIKIEQFKD